METKATAIVSMHKKNGVFVSDAPLYNDDKGLHFNCYSKPVNGCSKFILETPEIQRAVNTHERLILILDQTLNEYVPEKSGLSNIIKELLKEARGEK